MSTGLVVGGWFASRIIPRFINAFLRYAKNQPKIQSGLKEELERLEKALPKIQAVLNAVDQGLIKEENPPLEKWLWQLRDAADQADDVMDEMEYNNIKDKVEAERNKVNKAISNFKTFLERAVHKDPFLERLITAVKQIDYVASDVGEFYMLVKGLVKNHKEMAKLAINSRETSSVLNVRTHVHGWEKEKGDIIRKLFNHECKVKGMKYAVLPIIGAGGVGKTTLAQLVYNDPEVEKYFDLRMWVWVPRNFDAVLLTKKLYESAFGQTAEFDNFDLMQMNLKNKLKSKKFLVVFDDAWNDSDRHEWQKLFAPLKSAKSGSMILLTTRMETVAKLTGPNLLDPVFLEGLNEGELWNIFAECAFGGEDPKYHKELVKIGRGIVRKLNGSPLAAKTVGGILCSKLSPEYWTSVLQSELWSLQHGPNDIMPALRLTYQHLPSHLKPCFSFCSIFPQGYVFIKHDLINMWIALGLVPRDVNSRKRPEDIGAEFFDGMLNRSIFRWENPDSNRLPHYPADVYSIVTGKEITEGYVMDNLMHELATFVSRGECYRTDIINYKLIPPTVRHLYVCINAKYNWDNFNLKNIRTLIVHVDDSSQPQQVNEILKKMRSLRVLTLLCPSFCSFPESASDLSHLRYLSISSITIREIPRSVSVLYLLETIVCGGLQSNKQEQLDFLVGLLNLRHLIVPDIIGEEINGLGRLTSLQELSCSVGKDSGFRICDLGDMRQPRRLSISNVNNVRVEEAKKANLKNKVRLRELSLQWERDEFDENVFDYLEPYSGLKELRIRNYMGGKPPVWLETQALSKLEVLSFESMLAIEKWSLKQQPGKLMKCLKELIIDDCPKLYVLPPLPVSLKKLKLNKLGLFVLPDFWEEQSDKSESMSSLVNIEISYCRNLRSLDKGLLSKPENFVALREITIVDCKELRNLPRGGFKNFTSLRELRIRECPNIEKQLAQECFLPSSLQKLYISSCGDLEVTLPKALERIHSLIALELSECSNIANLPSKEVFTRWKTLKSLTVKNSAGITSLENLVGLSFVDKLEIYGWPMLFAEIPSELAVNNETKRGGEEHFKQTMDQKGKVEKWFSAFFQSMLVIRTIFSLILRIFLQKSSKSDSAQSAPTKPSSSMERADDLSCNSNLKYLMDGEKRPQLTVSELVIDDPLLLSIEPFRSLSAVRKLNIKNCSKLRSLLELPLLPPFLEELSLENCCPKLKRRCRNNNVDWDKVSDIPDVFIRGIGEEGPIEDFRKPLDDNRDGDFRNDLRRLFDEDFGQCSNGDLCGDCDEISVGDLCQMFDEDMYESFDEERLRDEFGKYFIEEWSRFL